MKILVVRVGRAGDIIMITPALKVLLNHDENIELHVLTTNDAIRVLDGFHGRLTKIIVYNRKALLAFIERNRIKAEILTENYDKIYCFEYGLSYRNLLARFKNVCYFEDSPGDVVTHYSYRCLQLLQQDLKIDPSDAYLNLPVLADASGMAHNLLKNIITDKSIVIGFHPTFSGVKKGKFRFKPNHENRLWSPAKFAELANKIIDFAEKSRLDIKIIMDLLPEEEEIGKKILQLTDNKVFMLAEKPNFQRYKAILKAMDLLVTTNTGPMHVAAAVGTKHLVVLFGGKHHPDECGPYISNDRYTALHTQDTCQPELGLDAIDSQVVYEACLKYLPEKKLPN